MANYKIDMEKMTITFPAEYEPTLTELVEIAPLQKAGYKIKHAHKVTDKVIAVRGKFLQKDEYKEALKDNPQALAKFESLLVFPKDKNGKAIKDKEHGFFVAAKYANGVLGREKK